MRRFWPAVVIGVVLGWASCRHRWLFGFAVLIALSIALYAVAIWLVVQMCVLAVRGMQWAAARHRPARS